IGRLEPDPALRHGGTCRTNNISVPRLLKRRFRRRWRGYGFGEPLVGGDSVLGCGASGVTFFPLTPTRTSRTVRTAATTANVKIDLAPPLEPSSSVIGLIAMAISPDFVCPENF
ncbi:MAG: hypothetical protein WBW37_09490, partial [Methyloceanibacter sp.]